MVVLHSTRTVPRDLFNAVRFQLTTPDLYWHFDLDEDHTTEELCGDAFWACLGKHDRRMAGMCLSHLSHHGEVPLVRVTPPGVYPVRYRLKPPSVPTIVHIQLSTERSPSCQ